MHLCVLSCISFVLFHTKKDDPGREDRRSARGVTLYVCLCGKMFHVLFMTTRKQVFNKFVTQIKMASLPCLFGRELARPHRSSPPRIAAAELCCSARSPRRRRRSAGVCRASVWPTTKTGSQVQRLFSGGKFDAGERVGSSIRKLLALVCPNAPMGKESPIH